MDSSTFCGQKYLRIYIEYNKICGKDRYDFCVYNQETDECLILSE